MVLVLVHIIMEEFIVNYVPLIIGVVLAKNAIVKMQLVLMVRRVMDHAFALMDLVERIAIDVYREDMELHVHLVFAKMVFVLIRSQEMERVNLAVLDFLE